MKIVNIVRCGMCGAPIKDDNDWTQHFKKHFKNRYELLRVETLVVEDKKPERLMREIEEEPVIPVIPEPKAKKMKSKPQFMDDDDLDEDEFTLE